MIEGFVNLCKESGMTSHRAVAEVRRMLGLQRIGHMGTLDPAAEGVLPLALGRATRLISFVEGDTKEYEAELVLGLATNTWDTTGEIVATADASHLTGGVVAETLPHFLGQITQEPPMFSAIKVKGQKLVDLARQGVEIVRERRAVVIHRLKMTGWREDGTRRCATLLISCSKGTYVRSLCRDIGARLGIAACMGKLMRTASGPFELAESVTLEEFRSCPERHIETIEAFLLPFPRVMLDATDGARFVCGKRISMADLPEGEFAVFSDSRCVGIGLNKHNILIPTRVLSREENP